MDDYSLLHFLDKKLGPFSVRGWMLVGSLAWYGYTIVGSMIPSNMRDAHRITSRASSWRGISTELAEALVEPLADRLVGALMRRGAFVAHEPSFIRPKPEYTRRTPGDTIPAVEIGDERG